MVTSDYGNAEGMVNREKKREPLVSKDGDIQILTSHTLRPVSKNWSLSCILVGQYEHALFHL